MSDAYEVNGLWRYPVKSMAGEAVEAVELDADGVAGDRRWVTETSTSQTLVMSIGTAPSRMAVTGPAAETEHE